LEDFMATLREWICRLWGMIRWSPHERELEEELRTHLQFAAEDLQTAAPEDPSRAARLRFGGVSQAMDAMRDQRGLPRLDTFTRDVRYGIRSLLRTPGFSLTIVLTLALGTGADTAVFSAVNTVLLRPLPFPDADRLVHITQTQQRSSDFSIAPVRLEDWNQQNSTLEAITGYLAEDVSDTSGDIPTRVRRASVAPRFFDVWGIAPAMGRGFSPADYQEGASVVVISDGYWRSRRNADPNVLGKQIRIGAAAFSIVGVMPASFRFPDRNVDLWLPYYDRFASNRRAVRYNTGVGRLKPGVTLDQARADLDAVQAELARQHPDTDREIGVRILPLKEMVVGDTGESLWLLFGAVSVLLLISCINIATLMLSRAAHREREIAVRLSIGASRSRVAAQVLIEAAILAFAGTLLGLLIGAAGSAGFRRLVPEMPRIDEIAVDGKILLYTLASMSIVTFLCGVFPAIRSTRTGLTSTLAEASRTHVAGRQRLQWLLVGMQVALSVTLLAGAGLLLRSFQELSRVNLGFQPRRVLAFRVSATWAELGNMPGLMQQIDRILDGLRTIPGVESAATSVVPPGVPSTYVQEFQVVEERVPGQKRMLAGSTVVSPSYFETLQLPLVAGEICRQAPDAGSNELMVNSAFANRYLSGSSGIGRHLAVGGAPANLPPGRIVGIIADTRERGIDRYPAPTVYFCSYPAQPFRVFLVRTQAEPMAVAPAIRLKIKELEPLRSVYDMAPLEEWIGDAFAQNRLRTVLLVSFALTALSLACIGLYGTLSYVVSLRRREVGLRLALGALRRDIVGHYVLKGLRVVAPACAAGLALAAASGRFISGMLYGVSAYDPATLAVVVVIVVAVATLASLLPAARAATVEPVRALREE
jgi:putative ABC transport system permease protein